MIVQANTLLGSLVVIKAVALIYVAWYALYEVPSTNTKQKSCRVRCKTCKCQVKN